MAGGHAWNGMCGGGVCGTGGACVVAFFQNIHQISLQRLCF